MRQTWGTPLFLTSLLDSYWHKLWSMHTKAHSRVYGAHPIKHRLLEYDKALYMTKLVEQASHWGTPSCHSGTPRARLSALPIYSNLDSFATKAQIESPPMFFNVGLCIFSLVNSLLDHSMSLQPIWQISNLIIMDCYINASLIFFVFMAMLS